MSRFLSKTGTGKITNVSIPKVSRLSSSGVLVPIPEDQATEINVVVKTDNYEEFGTMSISMLKPTNDYYSSFQVGDEVTIEEYLTPVSYADYARECKEMEWKAKPQEEYNKNPGHTIDYEVKHLVLEDKPQRRR